MLALKASDLVSRWGRRGPHISIELLYPRGIHTSRPYPPPPPSHPPPPKHALRYSTLSTLPTAHIYPSIPQSTRFSSPHPHTFTYLLFRSVSYTYIYINIYIRRIRYCIFIG